MKRSICEPTAEGELAGGDLHSVLEAWQVATERLHELEAKNRAL